MTRYHKKSRFEKQADRDVAMVIITVIAIPFVIVFLCVSGTYHGVKYISKSCRSGYDVVVTAQTKPDVVIGIKPDEVIGTKPDATVHVPLAPPPTPRMVPSPSPPLPQMSALPPPLCAVQTPPSPPQMPYVTDYHLGPGGLAFRAT